MTARWWGRSARVLGVLYLCVALGASGCRRRAEDDTPEGVVREWVERMSRMHGHPEDASRAFELLSAGAKENLGERARRASAATGRQIGPAEMLVPSRFSLRFAPKSFRARIAGDRALVEVTGQQSQSQRAEVACVREDGKWRVELDLPPLPAIERRPDGGL